MATIKVVIAEERTLFRQGTCALLRECADFEVVGEAAAAEEVRLVCTRTLPDVILLSERLAFADESSGLHDALRVCCPDTAIVVLTNEEVADTAVQGRARQAGIARVLHADIDRQELVRVLRAVVLPCHPARHTSYPTHFITEREQTIITLIAQGLSNKEIAHRLDISTQTVKNHVSHLLEKLAFADRTQLAVYAVEHHFDFSHNNSQD